MIHLLITADDFGKNHYVNRAVDIAKKEGVLTSASLMVTGENWEEAVEMAKEKDIDIGLHISLTEGRSIFLKRRMDRSPAFLGISAQFNKNTISWIRKEVFLQFKRLYLTGLSFSHVDSHHHIHIHPKILRIIIENCKRYGIKSIRFPYEPWYISYNKHRLRNISYRVTFSILSGFFLKTVDSAGLIFPDGIFGLYNTGEITETWLLLLLDKLYGRAGVFEIYLHPEDKKGSPGYTELKAITSQRVRDKIKDTGIKLISFSDLANLTHI